MKKSLLVVGIIVIVILAGGCSANEATSTTATSGTLPETSTSLETTSTSEVAPSSTTTTSPPDITQTVRHQQNESRFTYAGKWTTSWAPSASKGTFAYANSSGAAVTVRFIGTHLSWLAKTSPLYGKAKVTLDGGNPVTVDLYSAKDAWQQVVWKAETLSLGPHSVTIAWTGQKAGAAKDTNINVDAIDTDGVVTGLHQQTNAKLVFAGSWNTTADASASGGSFAITDSSGSSVTVDFTGIKLDWLAKTGPDCGQATVTVDGGSPGSVDLYSAAVVWKKMVWSTGTLSMGSHSVKIEWTGTKNSAATGASINVDAVDVTGTLK